MTTSLDPATDSITDWLRKSENRQDPNSFDVLWRNFGLRLVRLARIHLRGKRDPAYGSDDLALSAFCQACNRLEQGFLDNLSNSKDLWKLLVKITKQKSINLGISIQNRKDRLVSIPLQASASILDLRVDRRKATVDELGLIAEETAWLLQMLRDHDPTQELSRIALMLLEGRSKNRIARELGHTRRTIDARLDLIKSIWNYYLQLQTA